MTKATRSELADTTGARTPSDPKDLLARLFQEVLAKHQPNLVRALFGEDVPGEFTEDKDALSAKALLLVEPPWAPVLLVPWAWEEAASAWPLPPR